jgi:hypothetical protein
MMQSAMDTRMNTRTTDTTMAVFLDLENIALGARDASYPSFDIQKVLERLLLKGHIVVKKAYCDFDRYKDFKRSKSRTCASRARIPPTSAWSSMRSTCATPRATSTRS